MSSSYRITVIFNTDRDLTEDEQDALAVACLVQVEDPADHTGESKRASFETSSVEVELEKTHETKPRENV
jgi:hypothetical protein